MGVELKRGTMANWVIQVSDLYLCPFWKRIRSELLTQRTIHADETVIQVHKEKGRSDISESRMWVYSSAKRADNQLRCFEYRESRSGKWAKNFLEGFSSVLITDGTAATTRFRVPSVRAAGRTCVGSGWMRCQKALMQRPATL